MFLTYVSIAYTMTNMALALIIFFKSRQKVLTKFYVFCVFCLVSFGIDAFLLNYYPEGVVRSYLEPASVFLFSVFPFLFLHFMVIFIRRFQILKSKTVIVSIYFVGIFCYTLALLGFIPKPFLENGGLSTSGYVFYLTWMSIFFAVGIAMLYTLVEGFSEHLARPKLLLFGFALLLFILPGPFAESVTSTLFNDDVKWYFISSTVALLITVYLVFRHKIIVTTPYDALKLAISAMNDVLFKTNENFKIEMAWGATTQILGYSQKELVGIPFSDIVLNKDYLNEYRAFALDGKMKECFFDTKVLNKKGDSFPMTFSLAPVVTDEEITGFVGVGKDRRDVDQLQLHLARVQKIESVGELASGIAHDFRNILSTINLSTSGIQRKLKRQQIDFDEFNEIKIVIKRATDLVNKLSRFVRQEEETLVPLQINSAINETFFILKHTLGAKIVIQTSFQENLPAVMATETMLQQIFVNLALNARDAMPTGGTITFTTEMIMVDEIFATGRMLKPGNHIKISISDTGTGIPKELFKKVFEPFFTTKPRGVGTGLGLAIIFGVVRNLNGFIDLESEVGKGTSFIIYFPSVTTQPELPAASHKQDFSESSPSHIESSGT